ncbi:MAG TPA: carboxymuconolactone decarboxylase family protein [Pyrinomonadaceae bacterium]|nr:carboxymuconolactone decarboxylase family protein [Pyrinomonadaceae bacterium]
MEFTVHKPTTAPKAAQPILEATEKALGFIPNLYGVFAESPAALHAYTAIAEALKQSALTAVEQQVVAVAVSAENECAYCVAAHSTIATMVKMPQAILNELRSLSALSDEKLEALRKFAVAVVKKRGWVPKTDTEAFFAAGYTQRHVLEVITVVAMKTMSNYVNHIAETPIDQAFASQQWSPRGETQAA